MKRFPDDFMFQLTKEELKDWRSQSVPPMQNTHSISHIEKSWCDIH